MAIIGLCAWEPDFAGSDDRIVPAIFLTLMAPIATGTSGVRAAAGVRS